MVQLLEMGGVDLDIKGDKNERTTTSLAQVKE